MDGQLHAFDVLAENTLDGFPSVCTAVGDDGFLKRIIFTRIRHELADDGEVTELEGSRAEWRDVFDELSTLSLFGGGPRIVIVHGADDFVTKYRSQLEDFTAKKNLQGSLILDLKSLASNTKLFKLVTEHGVFIECKPPQTKKGKTSYLDESRLLDWLREWAANTHNFKLKRGADEELLHLVGPELGLLDQELAKLALFCDSDAEVTVELVRQVVGGWRTKTTWELLDAALDGNAAEAMSQLERLLQAGEAPHAIVGAMLWSLRRFADAAHLIVEAEQENRKLSLTAAMEQAGFKKWPRGALQRSEKQLRQVGRARAAELYHVLLELDLAMKGSHSTPTRARWAIEQLLMSLSKQAVA